jgi:hypothetical protein
VSQQQERPRDAVEAPKPIDGGMQPVRSKYGVKPATLIVGPPPKAPNGHGESPHE